MPPHGPGADISRANGKKRKAGTKWKSTLAKEAARELVRRKITAAMEPMIDAQVAHAQGIQHFVLRNKDGRFEPITSGEAAIAAMNDPEAVYEFWTKDPSVQAFTDLMNRALDKPKEQAQDINMNVKGDELLALIAEGRIRAHATYKKG